MFRHAATAATQPLHGLKVLELASVLAGPSVGQFLAELGADVVKVENLKTSGDVTRSWRLPNSKERQDGPSSYFSCCNLGKRSLAVDASAYRGQELCRRLALSCDVVLASYKPGDAEKLGLDATSLRSSKPSLIYAQVTGYGLDDDRVGFDALVQAEAGFTYMNGQADEAGGMPTKMPVALIDVLTGHQLKEAILLALLRRASTGEGAHLHVSLMASAVASLANQATGFLIGGVLPQRIGSEHPSICPYGTSFRDIDGLPLILAVGTDAQFRSLCTVLCPELLADERYSRNVDRVKRRSELLALLQVKIETLRRDELLQLLKSHKVPAGAIADMKAVFETPQAESLVVRDEQGHALGLRQVAWLGDGAAESVPTRTPAYGEHSKEILMQLGLTDSEVASLRQDGLIAGPCCE